MSECNKNLLLSISTNIRSRAEKIISPALHGYLDYVTVVVFLIAPTLLGMTGMAGTIAYFLAGIHLAMTLVTDFPLGVVKKLSFTIHGWVERLVSPVLFLLPFGLVFDGPALGFYLLIGIVIILVGLLTDYQRTQ